FFYSERSVTAGSTRDARQAGSQLATAAAVINSTTTPTYDTGSSGDTPNSSVARPRLTIAAAARPITTPAIDSDTPCFRIIARIFDREAPSAVRTPISRMRSL